jgi:hypothetical protein
LPNLNRKCIEKTVNQTKLPKQNKAMRKIFLFLAFLVISFSCFSVKCIIKGLGLIAVIKIQLKSRRVLQANASVQQRKEPDVKTKQPIQIVDVTYTKIFKKSYMV